MPNILSDDLERVLASTPELWEELRGQRIFITGGTGFFGCWLLETLLWANDRLGLNARATVLTRSPRTFEQKAPHLARHAAVTLLAGDVRSFPFPDGRFSHVIHAATQSSAMLNREQPALMFDTIVEGTRRCLEFAAASGARRFLLTSSGAVYGTQPPEVTHLAESFTGGPDPLDPNSAYGEGKRAAETLCVLASRGTVLETKIARCFAFAGPYMELDAHFAIGNFIRDQLNGGPIRVHGDGTPYRSYLYASDLTAWLWTILFRGTSGRAYNVGAEEAVSIRELARLVANAFSPPVNVEILGTPTPGAPAQRYVPSTARARQELGLTLQVPLQQAIQRTRNWFHQTRMAEVQKRAQEAVR
jgi:nucleoside-diphosphate-sugar epimerase